MQRVAVSNMAKQRFSSSKVGNSFAWLAVARQAEREAQKKAHELLQQQTREEELLYLAHEEQWTT